MSKKVFEMKQERANVTQSIRTLIDKYEGKEMPAEDMTALKNMEASFDNLNNMITTEERQIERERALGEMAKPEAVQNVEIKTLFANALSGDPNKVAAFHNALDLGTSATAGYLTAPVEFVQTLIKGLDDALFMRQISNVVGPIGAAQSLGFPYRKTAAVDATWVTEVTAAVEESTLDFGRREFKPNKMAKLIKMSKTLVQHAPMAERVVLDELRRTIGAGAEKAYLTGNGTAQPLGIFTASASGINTDRDFATGNTETAVTFEGLMEAVFSIKQAYRANASWVMHNDLAKALVKIKDGNGQYIWQGAVTNGQPDRLFGAPVFTSAYAPNTYTTGLYAAVYGDFKQGYWICDANGISLQVLNELYSVNNQVGYLVDYFGDGAPVLPEAFARVTMA